SVIIFRVGDLSRKGFPVGVEVQEIGLGTWRKGGRD
ncbi:MAG: hypothetical protein ACI9QL_003574, partial [Candidatus Omnitrophota bacterium]